VRSQLVLTLIGRDRPGLVETLAAQIARHGGNWEESRMAHLAGQFAGILRVSVPAEAASTLIAALSELEREGLRIVVQTAEGAQASAGKRLRLALVGTDREGIVREVSGALVARGVNVDELHTSCEEAPMGGANLFKASALLRLPALASDEASIDALRAQLEGLADDLMVELSLDAVADERKR
jgi:glycine cleavage system regulatory protein